MDIDALLATIDNVADALEHELGDGTPWSSNLGVELRQHGAALRRHGQELVTLAQSWEAKAEPHRDAPRTTQRRLTAMAQLDCALELRHLAYPLISTAQRTVPGEDVNDE